MPSTFDLARLPIVSVVAFVLTSLAAPARAEDAETQLTFEKHIRPIFRVHCYDCHGATEELEGELDLRLVRFMTKGGESGPALVVGKADESYLLERIESGEMPPGEAKVSEQEIATIRTWIAQGAKVARPEPETLPPGLGITAEERSYWAFQPITRPALKPLGEYPPESRVLNAIDALVTEASDAPIAPAANRRVLVLRAYFSLTGLPPSPTQLEEWLSDKRDDWYDQLISELLASPHYGERWARHWLDVAGYADSEGFTTSDSVRPWAWRYRDWVIRALNEDKPFDRFLLEQLAGDELAGPRNGDLTPEQIELLTATGYLRMAADGTGSGADNVLARNQVVADTIKIVGTSLLGMSLHCAACHDHRYDPIPQSDYFAMRAVFEPALDYRAWKSPNARRVSLYTDADRKQAAKIDAAVNEIQQEKNAKQAEFMKQALEKELEKFKPPLKDQLRQAYETPAKERSEDQKKLLDKHPSVNITPGVLYQYLPKAAEELKKFDKRMADERAKKPEEMFIRALVEPANHLPETRLFHRGDPEQPKQVVSPAALSVLSESPVVFPANDPDLPTSGRRTAFAKWLASSGNPLTARVIVNRVWMHHFGEALAPTPGELGRLGAPPRHPELLDWLADEFVREGWSLKKLHRTIMNSAVWRQARTTESPFRQTLQRLEGEAIRDRVLAASGKLDLQLYGRPIAIKEDDAGQVDVDGKQTRRSLYIQVRRSRPVAMLQAFDTPVMETNCERRQSSTVATQSLMLLNGKFMLSGAAHIADRAARETDSDQAKAIESLLETLPPLERPAGSNWSYGYGRLDEQVKTVDFKPLPHWNGSYWTGGPKLPDPKLGWVLLRAEGGHTAAKHAAIRRWRAPADGSLKIEGKLSHGSENGNGVQGRIVSSSGGLLGEWIAENGASDTVVESLAVKAGDTIDFLTDARGDVTSDSFGWPVTLQFTPAGAPLRTIKSTEQFSGPLESPEQLLAQARRIWQLIYCRAPTANEWPLIAEYLNGQMRYLKSHPEAKVDNRSALQQSLVNLAHVLLGSNEFLYVE